MSKYGKLKASYLEKNRTLATLILIKLFVKMLKISKKKKKRIGKKKIEKIIKIKY